mmetsp:Transcript_14398/g.28666  ORF Transcript_14398/g.28666 Transcript_14398/m.28666 type:complete len:239 (+) Transcript_14398:354-1070(+)|eukprot:CAMPEP_0182478472 /NCGR_PEP_ID=MMETSP1319-20130603/32548_1 /TAXON_ID=172717 /ORGANISM="Bolidomonas pacifica, Strain RCC208" /LENGTH=238 /DNA_ID=CAMNT_0024679815 /DNA_START=257 /DNA_END=973 /DNA_ORIENTATION=-
MRIPCSTCTDITATCHGCDYCKSRRVACDKNIPCSTCVTRGVACTRAPRLIRIRREDAVLHEQVDQVETPPTTTLATTLATPTTQEEEPVDESRQSPTNSEDEAPALKRMRLMPAPAPSIPRSLIPRTLADDTPSRAILPPINAEALDYPSLFSAPVLEERSDSIDGIGISLERQPSVDLAFIGDLTPMGDLVSAGWSDLFNREALPVSVAAGSFETAFQRAPLEDKALIIEKTCTNA